MKTTLRPPIILSCLAAMLLALSPVAHAVSDRATVGDSGAEETKMTSAAGDWTQFHSDSARAGFNSAESVINPSNVPGLQEKWSFMLSVEMESSPAVAEGILYAGGYDGYLYALNASTGAFVWRYGTGSRITTSGPAVANGIVYVGAENGYLYAVRTTTGTLAWKTKLGGRLRGSPAVEGGVAYIGTMESGPGYVYAVDAATGVIKWKSAKTQMIRGSVAVANGRVYVGSDASALLALDARTGTQLWAAGTSGRLRGSPSVGNGMVYVGDDAAQVYAFDAVSGALRWKTGSLEADSIIQSTPALAYGTVYVVLAKTVPMDGFLYAFDAATGAQRWVGKMVDWTVASPVVANGVVFTSSSGGPYAWDAITGDPLWHLWDEWTTQASPAISNGAVYWAAHNVDGLGAGIHAYFDLTSPQMILDSVPPPATPSTSAAFEFHPNEDTGPLTCQLDGEPPADCSTGTFRVTDLQEAPHSLAITATDLSGNVGTTTYPWVVDYTPPVLTLDRGPKQTEKVADVTFHLISSESPGESFTCQLDSAPPASCPAWMKYYGLPEGNHTWIGVAYDAAGNASAPVMVNWLQDTVRPDITADGPQGVLEGSVATFTFTSSEPRVEFRCRRSTWTSWRQCSSPYNWTGLKDGLTYTFEVWARDVAGNESPHALFLFSVVIPRG